MPRLKNHESPRKMGKRNIKGKGGSAKAKQIRKKQRRMVNNLKQQSKE